MAVSRVDGGIKNGWAGVNLDPVAHDCFWELASNAPGGTIVRCIYTTSSGNVGPFALNMQSVSRGNEIFIAPVIASIYGSAGLRNVFRGEARAPTTEFGSNRDPQFRFNQNADKTWEPNLYVPKGSYLWICSWVVSLSGSLAVSLFWDELPDPNA